MGLSAVKVQNLSNDLRPTKTAGGTAIADQAKTVSNSAVAMIVTALSDLTTHVMWTVDGNALRYTIDGSDPTSTNGHYVASGASDVWHRSMAEAAKWIRVSGDGYLHISELTM